MCGITGVASVRGGIDPERVAHMRDTMRHRGPDDQGLWCDAERRVVLGHRRLSIVDLSALGHQPMARREGRYQLVLNGEIYNYLELREELAAAGATFRSTSDTEVLLAAYERWGEAFLERLNGMFAFALFDAERNTLLLARDRAGEKPLFYAHSAGRLSFASELKALMADPELPRRIDLDALDHYLAFGYVAGTECMLAGVAKLAPAHALVYDLSNDSVRLWRYWSLPAPCMAKSGDVEALTDTLETLLSDSVRRQLVADVPVGVLLSGGVDSSIVTALASRVSSSPVRTYTISFPGHGVFDEAPFARIVAQHFGTAHTELVAEPATVDLLPQLAQQYDEPMADSSMVPTYLVSKLVRRECTVALGGDGGDELFGGYSLYRVVQAQQAIRAGLPAFARSAAVALAKRSPVGMRGRMYALSLSMEPTQAVARTGLYLDQAYRERLVPALGRLNNRRAEEYRATQAGRGRTVLQQLTASDFGSYLPDDILVKVDRASMLVSLEVRAPFLDHRVISFAFGQVPDSLRGTIRQRKILLRHLGKRLLPKELDLERKRGFSIPLHAWFKGPWGDTMSDVLENAGPGLFDPSMLRDLIAMQRRGLPNTHRIFALTMLELWRQHYNVGLPE